MHTNLRNIFSWIALIAILLAAVATPVSAAEAVTGTLLDESTTEIVYLEMSVDGKYVVNVEGNDPNEAINVSSLNGEMSFKLNGKKSWQLQGGICPADESDVWDKITDDCWWGLSESAPAATEDSTTDGTFRPNEAYDLNPAGEYVDCGMWYVDPAKKEMTWTGGSSFVHVCFNDEAKQLLKEGYTSVFTESVDFQVRACRSYWEGEDSDGNMMNRYVPAGCWDIPFRAGTYRVSGWAYDPLCGIQIGYRVVPNDTADWVEEKTCEQCVWPFPAAPVLPIYRDGGSSDGGGDATSTPEPDDGDNDDGSPTPEPPANNDRDGDGKLNDDDQCPDEYALTADGCPLPAGPSPWDRFVAFVKSFSLGLMDLLLCLGPLVLLGLLVALIIWALRAWNNRNRDPRPPAPVYERQIASVTPNTGRADEDNVIQITLEDVPNANIEWVRVGNQRLRNVADLDWDDREGFVEGTLRANSLAAGTYPVRVKQAGLDELILDNAYTVEAPAAVPAAAAPVAADPAPAVVVPAAAAPVAAAPAPAVVVPAAAAPVAAAPAPAAVVPAAVALTDEDLRAAPNANLTSAQRQLILMRYPTREALKAASVEDIRVAGAMGELKATRVYDHAQTW
jgi:hypothetical protein